MSQTLNTAIGIFNDLQEVELAVKELRISGYNMKKLSIAGGLMASWIIGPLSLGGAFASLGIPRPSIQQYENALSSNKFILIMQGNVLEVETATTVFLQNKALIANCHKKLIDTHAPGLLIRLVENTRPAKQVGVSTD